MVAALALAGCGGPGGPQDRTLTVLAAASLTESFSELARTFEEANPGVTVRLSFGASSALAQQVLAGAPADVLATASTTTMATVTDADRTDGAPVTFATNALVLVTPPADPGGVAALTDLDRDGVTLAVCAPSVPCGVLATEALTAAGVRGNPVTQEDDVKGVVSKVTLGEVDAGLVYRTDATAAGDRLRTVPAAELDAFVTRYQLATLRDSEEPRLGADFLAWVVARPEVLAEQGFGEP